MKVKAAQSCLTLCDHMLYRVHGIFQTRILEWVAFPFSRGSSQQGSNPDLPNCRQIFTSWATRKAISNFLFFWFSHSLRSFIKCQHWKVTWDGEKSVGIMGPLLKMKNQKIEPKFVSLLASAADVHLIGSLDTGHSQW